MSDRQDMLSAVWTEEEKTIGDLVVCRPTIHRMNTLIRRRNKWVADDGRDQTDVEAMVEWLFVLSRSREELQRLFRVENAEWAEMVDSFMAEVDDAVIREFQDWFEGIMDALRAGEVTPEGKSEPAEEAPAHAS